MESADFRSICQETIQTILKKEQQLEYAMKGSGCQPLKRALPGVDPASGSTSFRRIHSATQLQDGQLSALLQSKGRIAIIQRGKTSPSGGSGQCLRIVPERVSQRHQRQAGIQSSMYVEPNRHISIQGKGYSSHGKASRQSKLGQSGSAGYDRDRSEFV
jgi:hypothetical protein